MSSRLWFVLSMFSFCSRSMSAWVDSACSCFVLMGRVFLQPMGMPILCASPCLFFVQFSISRHSFGIQWASSDSITLGSINKINGLGDAFIILMRIVLDLLLFCSRFVPGGR